MEPLSTNTRFNNALNKLPSFNREKVYDNITKFIIKYPDMNIKMCIAVLDKLYKKDISYMDISAVTYINAVDNWNKFIVDSRENFDLLISGEDLVF
jgi:hypothetical protein